MGFGRSTLRGKAWVETERKKHLLHVSQSGSSGEKTMRGDDPAQPEIHPEGIPGFPGEGPGLPIVDAGTRNRVRRVVRQHPWKNRKTTHPVSAEHEVFGEQTVAKELLGDRLPKKLYHYTTGAAIVAILGYWPKAMAS